MHLDIVPAANFGTDELTALWNRSYEDYFVPIAFDRAMFERHVRRAQADLGLSRVIVADGEACGLSLFGRQVARGVGAQAMHATGAHADEGGGRGSLGGLHERTGREESEEKAVSYTHLTLPTN